MNQSAHSQYEPLLWLRWIRIAQLVIAIIVLAMGAYASSVSIYNGFLFSFFTFAWTIAYIPATIWGIPRIPSNYRPNIIILVLEWFTLFWWLIAFSLLAIISTTWTVLGLKKRAYVSSDGTYYATTDPNAIYDTNYNLNLGSLRAAIDCTKVGTAFAFFEFALFVASFVAICIKIHRQRRASRGFRDITAPHPNPNHISNAVDARHMGDVESVQTKSPHDVQVHTRPVQQGYVF